MSRYGATKINQKEYLKKYLSGDKHKKKKKDKKHKKDSTSTKVKIIDDDITAVNVNEEIDEDLLLGGEDAPQIVAEYIEERPNNSSSAKWRSIAVKEEPADDQNTEGNDDNLWGRKADNTIKEEHSPKGRELRNSPDTSPPRRKKARKHSSDRKRDYGSSSNESQLKRKSHDQSSMTNLRTHQRSTSSDQSPPRRNTSNQSPSRHSSPVHIKREKITPENSPDRQRIDPSSSGRRIQHSLKSKRTSSTDQSPPRRRDSDPRHRSSIHIKREKETPDNSPPRRRVNDYSPARGRHAPSPLRYDRNLASDSDQSPPRRRQRHSPKYSDRPPPRRRDSDQSPPRRHSPKRSKMKIVRDSSQQRNDEKLESPRSKNSNRRKEEVELSPSPPPTHKPKVSKTLDGKRAGLQDAQALQVETAERRRREERMFEQMSTELSGRDAEVQVRSTGRRGRKVKNDDPEERQRKEEHEQKKKELYDRWGKGLKQIEEHKARRAEEEYESSKPLARYSNDEDLDRFLREQERVEDPMLEYMRKKRKEREKETDKPQIPVYEGPYPENRFGIRPGYRWDGVDRSNGYEKRWFDKQNERRALQDEAYKYSVEDM